MRKAVIFILILLVLPFSSAQTGVIMGDKSTSNSGVEMNKGLQSFLKLIDTPSSFSGAGSNCVKVNAGETGLEFGSCGGGGGGSAKKGNPDYLYNDTDTIYLNGTTLNATIDQKLVSTTYLPTLNFTRYGTESGGNNIANLSFSDGNTYNVTEAAGVNAMEIYINFTGVAGVPDFITMGHQYTGTHEMVLELWDYTEEEWEIYDTITQQASIIKDAIAIIDGSNHVLNEVVQVRFRHPDNGNPSHLLVIDFINIVDGFSTITTSEHDGLSGRDNLENHQQYLDLTGTRNITGNLTVEGSYLQMYNHTITVAKRGGDYTSIQDAIDSITDATVSNKYAIKVYPGDYVENIVAKNNVYIVGVGGIMGQPQISSVGGTVYSSPSTFGLTGISNVALVLNATSSNDVLINITAGINGIDAIFANVYSDVAGVRPKLIYLSGGISIGVLTNSYAQYTMKGSDAEIGTYVMVQQDDTAGLDFYNVQLTSNVQDQNDTVIIFNESGKSLSPTRLSSNGITLTLVNTSYIGDTIFYNSKGENTNKFITSNVINLISKGDGNGYVYNIDTASSDGKVESSLNTIGVTDFKNNYFGNLGTDENLISHFDRVNAINKTTGDTSNFTYGFSDEDGQFTLSSRMGVGTNNPLAEFHANDSNDNGFSLFWATNGVTGETPFSGTYFGVNPAGESILATGKNFTIITRIIVSHLFHFSTEGNAIFPHNFTLGDNLDVEDHASFGTDAGILSSTVVNVAEEITSTQASAGLGVTVKFSPSPEFTTETASGINGFALLGNVDGWGINSILKGLDFGGYAVGATGGNSNLTAIGTETSGLGGLFSTVTAGDIIGLRTKGPNAGFAGSVNSGNSTGIYIENGVKGSGTIINQYQLDIEKPTLGTNNYQILLQDTGSGTGIWFNSTLGARLYAINNTLLATEDSFWVGKTMSAQDVIDRSTEYDYINYGSALQYLNNVSERVVNFSLSGEPIYNHEVDPEFMQVGYNYDCNCVEKEVCEEVYVETYNPLNNSYVKGMTTQCNIIETCETCSGIGRDMGATISWLRQVNYELREENEMIKDELCRKDNSYSWCVGIGL